MIQIQHVSKVYERNGVKNQALDDVNLEIDEGDVYGVIGYSGAGKSTLIRMVNALEFPTAGKVIVNGEDIALHNKKNLRRMKKRIGMVFQHFNLLETRTVSENVAIPLILEKKNRDAIKQRVAELLAFVGLADKANSYPNELSGGQKQRVGIARALALNPFILLCDEATSALDPKTTEQILELLKKINAAYNITILIITHEMGVIQKICNKVAVMEKGKIIEKGSVIDVFKNPEHHTTRDFVRSVIKDDVSPQLRQTLPIDEHARTFKLEFIGEAATKPLVSHLIKQFNVMVNIIFANMSEVQEKTLGHMVIRISGGENEINEAVVYLQNQDIQIEEVRE